MQNHVGGATTKAYCTGNDTIANVLKNGHILEMVFLFNEKNNRSQQP